MATNAASDALRATFGGGCFWGMEKWFKKTFPKGISNVQVGYLGGTLESPTYKQVCTGKTGHAEVVTMNYDPEVVPYKKLVKFFFRIHDSTTLNRQGGDVGTQYRSAIFYYDDNQKTIAEEVKAEVQKSGKVKGTIVTEITPATTFYPAEDYHQGYLDANPDGYCNHKPLW
jgi:peptide-methionine (S)-S-oxide reductase